MAKTLDDKREFDDFREDVLPKLRQMIKEGKKSTEIRAFAQSYLTARQVTIAISSEDEAAALRAIDALTHMQEGKPVERKQVTHTLAGLSDQELDSVLNSEMNELEGMTAASATKQ